MTKTGSASDSLTFVLLDVGYYCQWTMLIRLKNTQAMHAGDKCTDFISPKWDISMWRVSNPWNQDLCLPLFNLKCSKHFQYSLTVFVLHTSTLLFSNITMRSSLISKWQIRTILTLLAQKCPESTHKEWKSAEQKAFMICRRFQLPDCDWLKGTR